MRGTRFPLYRISYVRACVRARVLVKVWGIVPRVPLVLIFRHRIHAEGEAKPAKKAPAKKKA